MIIYVYIRTIKHPKVRLSHSFSVGDCKWSQRFRVSIPKCTRPSWGAIVNRCTSQMRDHAVTHPTLIPWSSSIRSYRRVLYKACDVEGFRKEVVLFKDLSQQFPSCSIHSCQTKPASTVKTKSIGHANLKFVGAVTLSPASWQVRHRYSPGFVFEHCGVWRPKDFMLTLSGFNRVWGIFVWAWIILMWSWDWIDTMTGLCAWEYFYSSFKTITVYCTRYKFARYPATTKNDCWLWTQGRVEPRASEVQISDSAFNPSLKGKSAGNPIFGYQKKTYQNHGFL